VSCAYDVADSGGQREFSFRMNVHRIKRLPLAVSIVVLIAIIGVVAVFVGSSTGARRNATASTGSRSCVAKPSASMDRIPFAEERSGSSDLAVVFVCIDGQGPYRFLLSTGASSSVIDPGLAKSLKLAGVRGAGIALHGVTCVATTPEVKARSWSVGGIRLDSQDLAVARVPSEGVNQPLSGVLGSDVLSRFGAVSIDYRTKHLLIEQKEGAPPKGNRLILGDATTSLPAGMSNGVPKVSVTMRVVETPRSTIIAVAVTVHHHVEELAVDSGSADSSLNPSTVRLLKLRSVRKSGSTPGIGCVGTAPMFLSGAWSLGGVLLPANRVLSYRLSASSSDGLQGALGSNVLAPKGTLVIDYQTAHLWLMP